MKRGEQFGSFTVLEDLGAGGMSEVFLARNEDSGEMVALKVLHASYATDVNSVPRFVREAETYRRLKHPNIVGYVGSGVRGSTYFIAMERVEGQSLDTLLGASAGPLSVRHALTIGLDLLRALDHAHGHGVIHRDLKPQNVMISSEGMVKLLDFGVARADDELLQTMGGDLLGSFQYSSPEQNRGEPVDPRSDLYSFGIIFWEMLTGQRVFPSGLLEVKRIQEAEDFRSPSSLAPEVPPMLDSVCRRLLRCRPEDRYQSAHEVLEELEDLQDMLGPE